MKKFTLLIIGLLFLQLTNAQNWKPINKYEKYNYSLGLNQYYATIWVDSVKAINDDSIFYLNKRVKKIQNVIRGAFWLKNQPNFLLSEIQISPNEISKFKQKNNIEYILKLNAQREDSWIFDSTNNIIAEVVKTEERMLFGRIDSVKIISLSNNDTIIISKNCGIIEFPLFDLPNQHVKLSGIEGRNLGKIIPKYLDFYDYNIGDVFCYKTDKFDFSLKGAIWEKYTILDKSITNETLTYNVNYESKDSTNSQGMNYTIYSNGNKILKYYKNDSFLNSYNNQLFNNKIVSVSYDTTFKTITKFYDNSDYSYFGDSINVYFAPNYNMETYGQNIGLVSSSYSNSNMRTCSKKNLIGYSKNNIKYGLIPKNDFFKSNIMDTFSYSSNINIYPNPAINLLTIDNLPENNINTIIISNISGLELIHIKTQEVKFIINIEKLKHGLYFIKILNSTISEIRKIIIE